MDSACHVMGCHITQEIRVQNAFDDVASTIHQSLTRGPAVKPVKGDALLFYDLDLRNGFEQSGLHAGCPVLAGVKWTATKVSRCWLKPVQPRAESAWFQRLKLNCDELV